MNFDNFFLRSFRILLFPFALLYGLGVTIRNYLYNKKILNSATFNFPLICVGNLAVGGTGKSPMVEYIVDLLHHRFKVATVSRGYKRKTKGYALANNNTTYLEIGDEPMQFHIKFPDVAVAVGEERIVAIPQLLHDKPETEVIILDDAFQHRAIKPGFNILLTECNDIFTRDFFLPTGNLRDELSSYKRAQVIVVTKCPENFSETEKNEVIKEIAPQKEQQIYFTAFEYGAPYHIINHRLRPVTFQDEVLLVYGIASPDPLKQYIAEHSAAYYQQDYGDHHIFTTDDVKSIKRKFDNISSNKKLIITTEKDAVRLFKFNEQLKELPIYVLPIRHKILFNEENTFNETIINFVQNFKKTGSA
ncbi:MAG: tetraacyldisaccharide 4'-kinase [Parafilimonas sp.]